MTIEKRERSQLLEDLAIIVVSIMVAIVLSRIGLVAYVAALPVGLQYVAMFAVGMLFSSLFTVGPATIILGSFAMEQPPLVVAGFGGFGAMCGDYMIFRFMRDRLSEDFRILLRRRRWQYPDLAGTKVAKVALIVCGALIIASPLPDEIGIACMGVSRVSKKFFLPLAFLLNAAGILAIGIFSRSMVQ